MPGKPFFPGATHWSHKGPDDDEFRSRWRETSFMFNQLRSAIWPHLPLADCLKDWAHITQELSETPRKRSYQTARLRNLFWSMCG